jgi:glycine cleavage system H lipoate-binding protein
MFPNDYAFHFSPVHLVFLGIFFTVAMLVAAYLLTAAFRTARALRQNRYEAIRWHEDFEDFPAEMRACRHQLTGEFQHRECPHAFDCRGCETHPKLIAKLPLPVPAEQHISGMIFPADRFYHRGHAWAKAEEDGTVTVGLDDLGQRLIGEAVAELPAPGAHLRVNGSGWRFRKGATEVRILSPVDGEVLETANGADGWFLRVKPDGGKLDATPLLRGAEVKAWITRELERLQIAMAPEQTGAALADGGVLMEDLPKANPEADWAAVYGEMFLEV